MAQFAFNSVYFYSTRFPCLWKEEMKNENKKESTSQIFTSASC